GGRDISNRLPRSRFLPLATDGGTSATVRYMQIPQLRDRGFRPALVTLTMGGNDLLQVFGNDDAAHTARRALWENGHAILSGLRELLLPGAPLVLGTIYDPSDGTGD